MPQAYQVHSRLWAVPTVAGRKLRGPTERLPQEDVAEGIGRSNVVSSGIAIPP
jgi:hypothetical protein